jgi:hypothetical protein
VWNPQTSISDYVLSFVLQYIKCAFPSVWQSEFSRFASDGEIEYEQVRSSLTKAGVTHDVRGLVVKANVEVVYLQNEGDWHVARHATPYMNALDFIHCGESVHVSSPLANVAIYFGRWGDGHAVPPKAMIEFALRGLTSGLSSNEVVCALERTSFDRVEPKRDDEKTSLATATGIVATAAINAQGVIASCDAQPSEAFLYAFYLLNNGARIAIRWYEPSPHAVFELPSDMGRLEIIAFVRDKQGNQSSVRIAVQHEL